MGNENGLSQGQGGYLDVDEPPSVGGTEVLGAAQGEQPSALSVQVLAIPAQGEAAAAPGARLALLQGGCSCSSGCVGSSGLTSVRSSAASQPHRAGKQPPESVTLSVTPKQRESTKASSEGRDFAQKEPDVQKTPICS